MSNDKALSWAYSEEFAQESEPIMQARMRSNELGVSTVSPATGAALQALAATAGAKAIAEIGTGTGVSGLWLLGAMGADGVLTTIDVEPELQKEARHAFQAAGYTSSRTRIIQGRASDVMPRMAARSYDVVVLDADPGAAPDLVPGAIRMLRIGGVLIVNRALYNGHVADPARRDPVTVAMRELGKDLRDREDLLTSLLPVGDGLLVSVRLA